jgi:hypothetical protein
MKYPFPLLCDRKMVYLYVSVVAGGQRMRIILSPQIQMIMAAVLAVLTTSLVMRAIVFDPGIGKISERCLACSQWLLPSLLLGGRQLLPRQDGF